MALLAAGKLQLRAQASFPRVVSAGESTGKPFGEGQVSLRAEMKLLAVCPRTVSRAG